MEDSSALNKIAVRCVKSLARIISALSMGKIMCWEESIRNAELGQIVVLKTKKSEKRQKYLKRTKPHLSLTHFFKL